MYAERDAVVVVMQATFTWLILSIGIDQGLSELH